MAHLSCSLELVLNFLCISELLVFWSFETIIWYAFRLSEVLKQVWDLSDQDNDSMLSLKEFCIALYLMERHREGHPLPSVLPTNLIFDESLLPASGQPIPPHGAVAWRHTPGKFFSSVYNIHYAWLMISECTYVY